MAFLRALASAISKIWSFAKIITLIVLVFAIAVFILTVFMPDDVLRALDIVTGWLWR
jgi:hypothetical protein